MDTDRLHRLLGNPDLAWLVDRVRARLEKTAPLTGTVTLPNARPEQRRAVELLLGRRAGRGTSVSVSLDELDGLLRTGGIAPEGLGQAVRVLLGDIRDIAAEQSTARAAWAAAFAPADALVRGRPDLHRWLDWLTATGLVRRLAPEPDQAADLLLKAVRVIEALPSPGIALGRLAADRAGGAHALDDGQPLATVVLAAARVLAGTNPTGAGNAAERRTAWSAVGVHRDDLSSTVLCAGLPGSGESFVGRVLGLARAAGEPCVVTLRQLVRGSPQLGVGEGRVWVCENPIVVATAADELGPACPPLVCLAGQPSAAAVELLTLLATQGADFGYHGDFDWGGVSIANTLSRHITWRPWRFDAGTYELAVRAHGGEELRGSPVTAAWDPGLRPALVRGARKFEEELFLSDLIADLRLDADGRMG
ncbi:TIGR02679 family protein [Alloactinosynnema sp. L-07]|uniref:TIGR02679 family protein n=1 Tax=Alloactinosynnema sp. L-07 TaxID=1653480 RepID=UPI0006B479A6|nr:TIGR02679 family protein [Alloactinosynnema sp. L-07]